jgi:hypothetical protein
MADFAHMAYKPIDQRICPVPHTRLPLFVLQLPLESRDIFYFVTNTAARAKHRLAPNRTMRRKHLRN